MSVYSEYLSKMWKLDCNLVALRRRPAEQISYRVLIEPLSNVLVTRAPNVIIYKLLHRAVFFFAVWAKFRGIGNAKILQISR